MQSLQEVRLKKELFSRRIKICVLQYFWIHRHFHIFIVSVATKMSRFNEGDITEDAAAYLLAIKESVSL